MATSFCPYGPIEARSEHPGILDWYTVIGGLVALVALTLHGALWITIKDSGDLCRRAQPHRHTALVYAADLTIVSLIATINVRPQAWTTTLHYPLTFVVPVGVVASLVGI